MTNSNDSVGYDDTQTEPTPQPPPDKKPRLGVLASRRLLIRFPNPFPIFNRTGLLITGLIIGSILGGILVSVWMRGNQYNPIKEEEQLLKQACDSPADDVSAIHFSPDGKYLATASLDNTVRVLKVEAETTEQVACQLHQDGIVAVKFSPDGTKIATASLDATAGLWKMNSDGSISKLQELKYQTPAVVAVDFSPNGKYLAIACTDGRVEVLDTNTYKKFVLKHSTYIRAVSFSSDEKYLATASLNNKAKLWELRKEKNITLPPDNVVAVAFSSTDSNYLATASADGTIKVWDTNSNKPVAGVSEKKGGETSKQTPPRIDDIPTKNSFTSVVGKEYETYPIDVSFSSEGKHVVMTGLDDKTRLWEWQKEKNITLPPDNVVAVAFSSTDSNYLATAHADSTIKVWETDGKRVKTLQDGDSLVAVAFNPTDGDYLATASSDGKVKIRKWK
ncbi:MAG: hypothetical protein F6K31_02435 [Symploca sp. SIO2G7]|nr:hypothetical protein [Symploca sp. SIO2G7]